MQHPAVGAEHTNKQDERREKTHAHIIEDRMNRCDQETHFAARLRHLQTNAEQAHAGRGLFAAADGEAIVEKGDNRKQRWQQEPQQSAGDESKRNDKQEEDEAAENADQDQVDKEEPCR